MLLLQSRNLLVSSLPQSCDSVTLTSEFVIVLTAVSGTYCNHQR